MTPEELRDAVDPAGSRPAPYWPQQAPPPGWGPGWKQKDAYEQRLAAQRTNGGRPDPRVPAWRAYDREVRQCWQRRMALVEHALDGARGAAR